MLPIKRYLKEPSLIIQGLLMKFNFLFPDKFYLKLMYRSKMGFPLNLKNPQRFSEKLQWLKLYDRKPQYTKMVDKIAVKPYVANIIGEEYIIPTLGVWEHFDDIDFDRLPDSFVLKTNHSGGSTGVIVCRDKATLDRQKAKIRLEHSLKKGIFPTLREWPYKDVKPMILAEKLLESDDIHGLMDYKVFCCNGEPKCVKVNYDVETDYHVNWYTPDWKYIEGTTVKDPTNPSVQIDRPKDLELLLDLSKKLSEGIPYLRVDFYINGKGLWFGELTFFPGSGFERFDPDSFDYEIGSWITLPKKNQRS